MSKILAGDVGATKVLLQAYDVDSQALLAEARYISGNFASLIEVIQLFQQQYRISHFSAACLGLPGPVVGREARLTNLPWVVDANQIEEQCWIDHVALTNDFYAAALGVDELVESDLLCLQPGIPNMQSNRLVVGAGTGLGVAPIKNCGGNFVPQSSEGGHIDFAPVNDLQVAIYNWCRQKWAHVSYERLLSGEGLETLYFFFSIEEHGHGHKGLKAPLIHQAALDGEIVANRALNAFVEIYGAYIGNLALIWESNAGVYIAGGIAPKISDWMTKPIFLNAFLNKGRLRSVVESAPIYLVLNEKVGLLGAMQEALKIQNASNTP
ncbi:glucokinase [Hydrogenovibrio sp. SC-1]|uniref:glucokinase n=1 Tax=Hydrogenovibrio sp. SC-1 TaxID=2065820 RepID=UPI000C7DEA0E|nr:glucokinase [Hydrogenovibrio sp. SC-1]PLA75434.1 glucokinase [Hydrogenovibrio sp. SC-1]